MTSLTTRGFKIKWVNTLLPSRVYTLTVPEGVYWIRGYIVGGGGGGGNGSSAYGGGAGGSGGYIAFQAPVTPGENIQYSAGYGGGGGGYNGGYSWVQFTDYTTLRANGGQAGGNASSTAGGSGGAGGDIILRDYRGILVSYGTGTSGTGGTSTGGGTNSGTQYVNAFFTGFNSCIGSPCAGLGGNGGNLNQSGNAGNNGIVLIWWEL